MVVLEISAKYKTSTSLLKFIEFKLTTLEVLKGYEMRPVVYTESGCVRAADRAFDTSRETACPR